MRWDLGTALLSEYDDDGFIGVQVDAFGEGESGMPPFELHHPFGFSSRPRDPDNEGLGCSVLYAYQGSEGFAWLANDPRTQELIPTLKKGGSVQYSAAGSFDVHDGEDGTKTVYVGYDIDADGTPQKAHTFIIGNDGNGDPFIALVHGDGMAVTMLKKKLVLKNASGNAYIELNDEGIILNGNVKLIGALLGGSGTAGFPVALITGSPPPGTVPATALSST